jgi:hypothetical protein
MSTEAPLSAKGLASACAGPTAPHAAPATPFEGTRPAPHALEFCLLRIAEDRVDSLLLLLSDRFGDLLTGLDGLAKGRPLHLPRSGLGAELLHLRLVGRPSLYRLLADPIEFLDLVIVQLELLPKPHDRLNTLAAHRIGWSSTSALPPLPVHLQRSQHRECGQ